MVSQGGVVGVIRLRGCSIEPALAIVPAGQDVQEEAPVGGMEPASKSKL
jgi:hypothetical protein